MSELDRKEIIKWLDASDIEKLRNDEGITRQTVYNRLAGRTKKNFAFITKAMNIALENKQRVVSGMERMKSLNPSL